MPKRIPPYTIARWRKPHIRGRRVVGTVTLVAQGAGRGAVWRVAWTVAQGEVWEVVGAVEVVKGAAARIGR